MDFPRCLQKIFDARYEWPREPFPRERYVPFSFFLSFSGANRIAIGIAVDGMVGICWKMIFGRKDRKEGLEGR